MVYALMTIHADWWPVLGLFVHNFGYCENAVIEDWNSVSKFNCTVTFGRSSSRPRSRS